LHQTLLDEDFDVEYDEAGSIGRRYARADEAGVPVAVTIDYETLTDDSVTLRDRDTWKQVRAGSAELPGLLREYIKGKMEFSQLGRAVTSTTES